MQIVQKLLAVQTTENMQSYMNDMFHNKLYIDLCEEDQRSWIKALQEQFLVLLKNGELPAVEMTLLYGMLDHKLSFEKNGNIESYRSHFLNTFLETSSESLDAYVMSALVVICDFLNGNFEQGLKEWLQSILTTSFHIVPSSYTWALYFKSMLEYTQVPIELSMQATTDLLKWENYSQLSLVSRRSIFVWLLAGFWNVTPYMNNKGWLALYPALKILSDKLLSEKLLSEQMALHFFTYHIYGNNIQTQEEWKRFSEDFDQPEGKAFVEFSQSKNFPIAKKEMSKGRKKIVFVKDRIVENSVFKVEYSLFKALMDSKEFTENYDLSIVSMTYIDKSFDGEEAILMLRNLGIEVVSPGSELHANGYYYDHLHKAQLIRNYIVSQETDIMILDASCFDISNFLLATRSAPKQIFWSHGNFAYDNLNIDQRIYHSDEAELLNVIEKCNFKYKPFYAPFSMENLAQSREQKEIEEIRNQFPKDSVILGSIGRLVKINSDSYLETVAQIMNDNPNTVYLACGLGEVQEIKDKVYKLGIADRFFFTGHIDAHLYGYVLDIYLNTFPLSGGESLNEFMTKGRIPIILLPKEHVTIQEMFKQETYKGYKRIHAFSKEDYITLANEIIKSHKLQDEVKTYINEIVNKQVERNTKISVKFLEVIS